MLLGRDRELARIDALIRRAAEAEGGVLVVSGAPGIGKSALLTEAARRAPPPVRVLRCRGTRTSSEEAFAGLSQLFPPLGEHIDRLPAFQRAPLRGALGAGPPAPADRRTIWAAALSLVDVASGGAPLAMLIDDVQWVDPPSLEAMAFVGDRLHAAPGRVALLVASRDRPSHPFLERGFPQLAVGPLDRPSARRLAAAGGLAAADLERVVALAGGNPLALLELPAYLGRSPPAAPQAEVADLVIALYRSRYEALSAPARGAAVVAAVCDDRGLDTVGRGCRALGLDADALSRAVAAGLVRVADGQVAFRHSLAREAVLRAGGSRRRRRCHEALADVLAAVSPERAAWHRAAERRTPDDAVAGSLAAVARDAAGRSSYDTAARAFLRAADLTADAAAVAPRLYDAARALLAAGQMERARDTLVRALPLTMDGPLRTDLHHTLGVVLSLSDRPPEALATFLTAAQDVAAADPHRAASLLSDATVVALQMARVQDARDLAGRAAALGAGANGAVRDGILVAEHITRVLAGGAPPATPADQITAMLDGLDRATLMATGLVVGAATFIWAEQFDRFDQVMGALVARGRTTAPSDLAMALVYRGKKAFRAGHAWAAAAADLVEAADLAASFGQRPVRCFALANHALLEAARGDGEAHRDVAREADQIAADIGLVAATVHLRSGDGLLALSQGDADAAVAVLTELRQLITSLGIGEPNLVWYAANLSEALGRLGRRGEAGSVAEALYTAGARSGRAWPRAAACRCRALGCDDPGLALGHLREALAWHRHSRTPFEEARTRLVLGEVLGRLDRADEAARQLGAAAEAFAAFGAVAWEARARRAGAPPELRPPLALDQLSPREFQVASLAVEGLTNREIAASMSLSARTVEHHLAHVYEKLGIRNRTALAGRFAAGPAGWGE